MKTEVCDKDAAIAAAARLRGGEQSGSSRSENGSSEMRQKMEAACTPGPAHRALDALVGSWKAEMKCWQEPGGEAQVSKGTAKAAWKFNGRFLEEEFLGEMMGKPFRGQTLLGFDNVKKTFNSVWISDTQTSIFFSEGKGDANSKVITLEGESNCPINGQRAMKTVLRVVSPDKHILEMFDVTDGEGAKMMEIIYTRQ
jgi:hypothetical protein